MKAIVLHEYGGPGKLVWEDVDDPVAGKGEVLVRVSATSVNPVDYKMRSGAMKDIFPVEFPAILGWDIAGVVRAVGEGVTAFAPGDKVMGVVGKAYAELVVAPANALALVPEKMEVTQAAALPLVARTGEQVITRGTKIKKGETVLITGALGSVGRFAVYTAKRAGAVVIAGVRGGQVEKAGELGADVVLALDDKSAVEKLGFVDAVADMVGGPVGEMLLGKVKPGGVFASVVGPPANLKMHPTVRFEMVQSTDDAAGLRALAEAVAEGKLTIPVERMLPLKDAAEAQAAAEKGAKGKILLLA